MTEMVTFTFQLCGIARHSNVSKSGTWSGGVMKGEKSGSERLYRLARRAAATGESLDDLFFGRDRPKPLGKVQGQLVPLPEDQPIQGDPKARN